MVLTTLAFIFLGIEGILLSVQPKEPKNFPSMFSKDLKEKPEGLEEGFYAHLKDNRD
ncbi:hypothetical protein [Flagellimonas lutimaris]|uniref:hypothetical protein n=1 Tax=Flagellimonas lutimaris TaxID=475082 RepID=UPI003F5CDFB1